MLRDTTITSGQKKRELLIILVCFLAAYLLNVIGIIQHNSPPRELFTQLHVVLLLAAIFYGIVIVLRIIYYLISRLWVRK